MTDLNQGILGIDISKAKFDVALMVAGKVKKTHLFENAQDGFESLSGWLQKQGISSVSACMEATGCYGDALAAYGTSRYSLLNCDHAGHYQSRNQNGGSNDP